MIEPILLAAACVHTFDQKRLRTNASGFFFARDERLFPVTSRHVVIDEPSGRFPNLIEIELHTDPDNMAQSTGYSIPLYRKSIWRQRQDSAGEIDMAVIEIERSALPETTAVSGGVARSAPTPPRQGCDARARRQVIRKASRSTGQGSRRRPPV